MFTIVFEPMYSTTNGGLYPRAHENSIEMVNLRPHFDQDASGLYSTMDIDNGIRPLGRRKWGDGEHMDQGHVTTSGSSSHEMRIQNSASENPDPLPFQTDDVLSPNCTASSETERRISSEFTRPCPNLELEANMAGILNEANTPNIIIFGEAGVGKSSVVNLIAGEQRTNVSSDALGCTFQHQRHVVTLNGMPFSLWDTTGLDEGSEGRVPAKLAENNLRTLMRGLAQSGSGGINLIIYCIRGSRLTRALKHNYDLFYGTVCRKKVPVALVVTGLEHQQGKMETWWEENKSALQRLGMCFDAHACVTTLDVNDDDIRERRLDSQAQLRTLVADYIKNHSVKVETSSISWVNILRGVYSTGKKPRRRVIIFDATSSCRTRTHLIGERQLECEEVYVNDLHAPSCFGNPTGTTVLVFYTSTLSPTPTRVSTEDLDALRTFHDSMGGKKCPVILVIRGCKDDQVAQRCWDAVASDPQDQYIQVHPVVDEQAKLDVVIEQLCSDPADERFPKLHKVYAILMAIFEAMARLSETLGEAL